MSRADPLNGNWESATLLSQVMSMVRNSSISALIIWRLDGVDSRKNGRREISRDPVPSVLLMNFSAKGDGEERLIRSCGGDQRPYFSRWEILVHVHALGGNPVTEEEEGRTG